MKLKMPRREFLKVAGTAALAVSAAALTGCGGTTPEPEKNYGEIVEAALNRARREYGLSEVKLDESLTEPARKEYYREVNGWQYVTIDGQKYKVVYMQGGTMLVKGMTVENLTETYKSYIKLYQDSAASRPSSNQGYAGVEDLAYIGLWTGTEKNGQIEFCVAGTIPA